jgi:hypothetical protein
MTTPREVNVEALAKALTEGIDASFKTYFTRQADLDKLSDSAKERVQKIEEQNSIMEGFKRFITDRQWAEANGLSMENVISDLKDSISLEEWRQLIPATISQVVVEAAEPEYTLTRIMRKVNLDPTLHIEFPMVGAIADAEEVGPGQEYPVRKFGIASQGIVRMGKVGLRMEVQDECIRYVKGWDIYGRMLAACGKAMGRTKEKRIAAHLNSIGQTVFDNLDSNYLNTSGVNAAGAQNGGFTLDDLVTMAGTLINDGFNPDTIIINGMAWQVFARVPELREFVNVFQNGQPWTWPQGQAGLHPSAKQNPMLYPWTTAPALSTQFVNPQSNLLGRGFQTVVTPYMSYTASSAAGNALTNIIVADSNYLGLLMQEEDVQTASFDDPRIDVRSTKFWERYAIASVAGGLGVRIARNVALVRSLDPLAQLQYTLAAGSVSQPGTKTALSV